MRSPAILALAFLLSCAVTASASGQRAPAPAVDEAVATALEEWRDAFRTGYMRPKSTIRPKVDEVVYGSLVEPGGLLADAVGRSSNASALAELLNHARHGGVRAARAVLGIAAVSHARRLTDPQAYEVRELGHWTLMRAMQDDAVRELLYRVADGREEFDAGEPVPGVADAVIADERPIAARVAAIAALGLRRDEPTRQVVEGLLADADERIRLAAAEALAVMQMRDSSNVVVMALRTEAHPVVAQALVVALDRILARHRDDPPRVIRDRMVKTALQRLGETGWRTDLALVALAERNPALDSVPLMIRVLEGSPSDDPLVQAINDKASPFLKQRAWRALRRLTGTLLPEDDPAAWWRFWEAEKDRIVLPEDPVLADARVKTHAGFFGIPITGREIAIIIDTSGSMNRPIELPDDRRRTRARSRLGTRLEVAKHELLRAVHAMPAESRYHLLTFSGDVITWNAEPVPPSPASYRALTECLGRIDAGGATNLYGALMMALAGGDPLQPTTGFDCDEIFVLTDGEPSAGTVTDPDGIVRIVEDVNRYRRVRIHTVHVGDETGADLMRRLAAGNEGVFVDR